MPAPEIHGSMPLGAPQGPPDPSNDVKNISYAYLIMKALVEGINGVTGVIKLIAQVEKDLQDIMNCFDKLKQLLQQLENKTFPSDYDPTKNTDVKNIDKMKDLIEPWLETPYSEKDPEVTIEDEMQNLWTELFGVHGDAPKPGAVANLKNDIQLECNASGETDTSSGVTDILNNLDSPTLFDGATYDDWNYKGGEGVKNFSFLDFLQGKIIDPGIEINITAISKMFSTAFCHTDYKNTGASPTDKGVFKNSIGDVNSQFDSASGAANGLNTTQNAALGFNTTQLSTDSQIAQTAIQSAGKETGAEVANQKLG